MSSRYALKARSYVLVFLMITMAQTGYSFNDYDISDGESNLDTTEVVSETSIANNDAALLHGGWTHSCVVTDQGMVKCWGYNSNGELGVGNNHHVGDNPNEMGENQAFTDLGSNQTAVDIDAGTSHVCAVMANGEVKCWGQENNYQLGGYRSSNIGDQPNEMGDSFSGALSPPSGEKFVEVTTSNSASCARTDAGNVYCWGNGQNYLVSSSSTSSSIQYSSTSPIQLKEQAVKVVLGNWFGCALLQSHEVQCWGKNSHGELFTGNTTHNSLHQNDPVIDFGTGVGATDIMAGEDFACAVLTTQGTVCWGTSSSNRNGRTSQFGHTSNHITLGPGDGISSPNRLIAQPHQMDFGPDSSGGCIINEASQVECWGDNHIAGGTSAHASPWIFDIGGPARYVATGDEAACAVGIDGSIQIIENNFNKDLKKQLSNITKEVIKTAGKNKLNDDLTLLSIGN